MPFALEWSYVQKFWLNYNILYLQTFFYIVIVPGISFALSAEIPQQSDSGMKVSYTAQSIVAEYEYVIEKWNLPVFKVNVLFEFLVKEWNMLFTLKFTN